MNTFSKILIVCSLALVSAVLISAIAYPIPAKAAGFSTGEACTLNFSCVSGCSDTKTHTMNITSCTSGDGAFYATGFYNANPAITWNAAGTLSGSNINFTMTYTGLYTPYSVYVTGTTNSNVTSMSGTATTSQSQNFVWNGTCTPTCTPNVTKQCVGNSVYNFDSCGAQGTLYQQCTSNQICQNAQCVNQTIACSTNSQCGTNAYTGSPYCQGNNVYQNYITYTCNNPGTSTSYCSNSTASQLKTTCTGNQTCNGGTCGQNCTQNSYQQCQGNYLYWYDSCGNQGSSTYCPNGCSGSTCTTSNCTSNSYEQCVGNNLYWYNSCGVQQSLVQYCPNGCSGNTCTNYNNCTYHSYEQCIGNNLYWYNSCGVQQDLIQYCPNGCSGSTCTNNIYNNPYGNCTYHAYRLCIGNNIYWYDSCGTQEDLSQTCNGINTTCQYGLCVASYQNIINPVVNTYVAHYKIACYANNLYWYDTNSSVNSLYKKCADSNSCTLDSCVNSKCSNTIKCDGTTCAVGSPDYNNYCSSNTNTNNNTATSSLSIAFFAKQDPTANQWQKTVQINSNGQIYFMMSVVNNYGTVANNVTVSANIPSEITSLGNLQVDGVQVSGDIVSGVNIGSLSPGTAKQISFEGKAQSITTQATKQAISTVTLAGSSQTDSVSIILNPGQVAGAAISSSQTTSGFWEWLKRWYLWILVALVLIVLFIIVFRRLSSNAQ